VKRSFATFCTQDLIGLCHGTKRKRKGGERIPAFPGDGVDSSPEMELTPDLRPLSADSP